MFVTFGTTKKETAQVNVETSDQQKIEVTPTIIVVSTAMVFSAGFLCGKHHILSTLKAESEIIRNLR